MHFFQFAVVGSCYYWLLAFSAGLPLRSLFEEGITLAEEAKKHQQDVPYSNLLAVLQMLSNLMGESKDPCIMTGEFMDEIPFLQAAAESKHETRILMVHLCIQSLAYYMGNFSLAHEAGKKCRSFGKMSCIRATQQAFFDGMTAMELARTCHKRSHLQTVCGSIKKMKKWAKHSPHNFLHKAHLLEAEMALVHGNRGKALMKYKKSIEMANDEGFVQDHALACERTGVALRHFGQDENAREYFLKAVSSYREWGALAKVDQLEKAMES